MFIYCLGHFSPLPLAPCSPTPPQMFSILKAYPEKVPTNKILCFLKKNTRMSVTSTKKSN
jgi:hypothetical protein